MTATDLKRPNSVGAKVIKDMHFQFLREAPPKYLPPADGELAFIVDIDGTIANSLGVRGPFEWAKVGEDAPNEKIIKLVRHLADTKLYKILLVSGRDSVCRAETEEWLRKHDVPYDMLLMRPEGDTRKDYIVKKEMFDAHIRDKFDIQWVFDDRNQTVEMWRELGLTCLQVAEGDF